ncbi:DEHA2G14828p [Debaryomyces hansenii CBS767]|jgi:hypothetical protein|uniref:DEHA2G14828p n=1 Tax=Debaryomyces hansenii (strain ATCC 36239 / CBS 767 / BCRC 21394 / JCM 1990 / NBRC 0083 / IGC 2968) TaxID=284592 RepID=Q6BHY6_DEBHA|nr:DEHA2G14828p [Debaryomyces hansenii CBS767]CAG90675.1 DEHA2G14828p [Debaryomyces hansenii CBS767]|eukprot:XP_462185.1 DEHA2G14828p [Debaryomyces hansenii CBS767]
MIYVALVYYTTNGIIVCSNFRNCWRNANNDKGIKAKCLPQFFQHLVGENALKHNSFQKWQKIPDKFGGNYTTLKGGNV